MPLANPALATTPDAQFGTRLAVWLRGDSVTESDGAVSQMTDRSGYGNHCVQATASKKPTYAATGGPNSTPIVSSDGTDDIVSKASGLSIQASAFTFYAVIRVDTAWSNAKTAISFIEATPSASVVFRTSTTTKDHWRLVTGHAGTSPAISAMTELADKWYLVRGHWNTLNNMGLYVFPEAIVMSADGTGAAMDGLHIFADWNETGHAKVSLADLVIAIGVATADDDRVMQAYVHNRYNPTGALPTLP